MHLLDLARLVNLRHTHALQGRQSAVRTPSLLPITAPPAHLGTAKNEHTDDCNIHPSFELIFRGHSNEEDCQNNGVEQSAKWCKGGGGLL